MNEEIVYRALEPSDCESAATLKLNDHVVFGTLGVPYTSTDFLAKQLIDSIGNPSLHAIVADLRGQIVGMVRLKVFSERRSHVGYIALCVHPESQGRGIGTRLLQEVVKLSKNWLGLRRLELTVFKDNASAIRIYKTLGFEHEGMIREFALRDGVYVDACAMGLLLS